MSTGKLTSQQQSDQKITHMPTASESGPGVTESRGTATRIRAFHVLILGGLTTFGPLSTDMYLSSLPAVSQDLGATMSQTQLTMSATILGLSLGQVLIGPISDARGRRWPLLTGIAVFVLMSLLCVVAPSVTALTITRFIQGIAASAGIVLSLAIARDLYAGLALARCISLLMTVNFLAPLIAPVLGSQVLTLTSWHGVFVALALIGIVALLAVAFGLNETLPADRQQRGGIAVTLRTFRDLLANRHFVGYVLTSAFTAAAGIVYLSSSPFIFQNIYGLSPMTIGFVFGGNALGLAIVAQVGARLVGLVAPQRLLALGVAALVTAGVTLLVVMITGVGLVGVLPALFVLTASLGLIFPNAASLALTTVKPEIAGSASALLGALQLSIGAILAPLVGIAGTSSAVPMAAAIAVLTIAALLAFTVLCRPGRKARAEEHA